MYSGKFAGETAVEAFNKCDFSENTLSLYQKKLENSFVLKDLKTYKNLMSIISLRSNSFLSYWPHKICEFLKMFIAVDNIPKRLKYRNYIKTIFTDRSLVEIFKDVINLIKLALGVLK
jgi:electron transfer flavoprotein-quinone oxidoreductase